METRTSVKVFNIAPRNNVIISNTLNNALKTSLNNILSAVLNETNLYIGSHYVIYNEGFNFKKENVENFNNNWKEDGF